MQPTTTQPELTRRQKDKLLFCIMLEKIEYHRTTFQYDLVRELKMVFNNWFNHFKIVRSTLLGKMTPQAQEFLDEMGATFWDAIHEVERAKNRKQIVALMKHFNDAADQDELLGVITQYHLAENKTEFLAMGVSYNNGELQVVDEKEYNELLTLNK